MAVLAVQTGAIHRVHELAHLRLEASSLPFEFGEARLGLRDLERNAGTHHLPSRAAVGAPAAVATVGVPAGATLAVAATIGCTR